VACVALGINLGLAVMSIESARDADASAERIIQIWVPHIYYAALITGFAISLYMMTRAED
jgi:ABC-type transport system involved in cytochrome c biogenesis permease subunit